MKTVFLCSGQGSLKPGTAKPLYDKDPIFRSHLDDLGQLCSLDLPSCLWGSRRLSLSSDAVVSHLVLFSLTAALYRTLADRGLKAELFMGHSLGQLIATILAEGVDLEAGIRLLRLRGELFEQNKTLVKSDMAAVMGPGILDHLEALESVEGVHGANFNTPEQLVVSFREDALKALSERAAALKLKVVRLQVGNGCHSPLVRGIEAPLREQMEKLEFRAPSVPLWSTRGEGLLETPEALKKEWLGHLMAPVWWNRSLEEIAQTYPSPSFVDLGFSKVVKGLVLGWNPQAPVETAEMILSGPLVQESL